MVTAMALPDDRLIRPRGDGAGSDPESRPGALVLVPPTVAGLATGVILYRALESPAVQTVDPLDLAAHLADLASQPPEAARLIVAGLPLMPGDVSTVARDVAILAGQAEIEWFDNHYWAPDAQAAVWPLCRRAEIGPDVPEPAALLAHQLTGGSRLALRIVDLIQTGTASTDAWVRDHYRLLAAVLPPERANLIPDMIAWTAAETDTLDEVEREFLAEEISTEKMIERLVREELGARRTPRGTTFLVADLGEWSGSPYLLIACRRFFTFQILIRVLPSGRIVVERSDGYSADLGRAVQAVELAAHQPRIRATRQRVEIDADLDSVEDIVNRLIGIL